MRAALLGYQLPRGRCLNDGEAVEHNCRNERPGNSEEHREGLGELPGQRKNKMRLHTILHEQMNDVHPKLLLGNEAHERV